MGMLSAVPCILYMKFRLTLRRLVQHCPNGTMTYNSKWPDGSKSYGGYADYWRGSSDFVVKIPDAIPSDVAAPMLCGGITTFSPLVQNKAGPGKKVGIVGIGGLGHFGIMGAKALGCEEIVAISRSSSKKEDAMKMGATKFIGEYSYRVLGVELICINLYSSYR
jgi:alcohol dehydrogenase (NADP+)